MLGQTSDISPRSSRPKIKFHTKEAKYQKSESDKFLPKDAGIRRHVEYILTYGRFHVYFFLRSPSEFIPIHLSTSVTTQRVIKIKVFNEICRAWYQNKAPELMNLIIPKLPRSISTLSLSEPFITLVPRPYSGHHKTNMAALKNADKNVAKIMQ